MRLAILTSSARPESRGQQISKWVQSVTSKNQRVTLEIINTATLGLPFYNEHMSPFAMKRNNQDYTNPAGKAWAERVRGFDGFIFLVAEYNHGYTSLLKNAIDWVGPEWVDKPVGFISYSTTLTGGARAVEQLRQVVVEVSLVQVANALHFPNVSAAFDDTGAPVHPSANDNLNKMLDELYRLYSIYKKD